MPDAHGCIRITELAAALLVGEYAVTLAPDGVSVAPETEVHPLSAHAAEVAIWPEPPSHACGYSPRSKDAMSVTVNA